MIVSIDDPGDPRIAAYRDVRERDLVGRERLFIAEGEVVVRVLLARSPHRAESLLIAEKRLRGMVPLIETLSPSIPVYVAGQNVMDGVVGFPMHRGILALGRRAPPQTVPVLLAGLARRAVIVVAFAIANHDNMGGIFRNAAAFGAAAVILDSDCCDPLYRKAIRVSVGAALIVPVARLDRGDDALAILTDAGFEAIAFSPNGTTTLAETHRPDRLAVLLGAEGPGLPPDILAKARTVRIPMAAGVDSLNVATASGIALHHFAAIKA